MKKKLLVLSAAFLCFINLSVYAQQDTSTIRQIDIGNIPYFAWGSGIGITSPDSVYQFNIRFRMQNLISLNFHDDQVDNLQARVRRLRLRIDGYVVDPHITYVLQLAFANEDITDFINNNPPNIVLDAMIFYSPGKNWSFGFGQGKLPGNRERINSSGGLQLPDRSPANGVFNIDRDFGLQAIYKTNFKQQFQFAIKGALTTGEGRNWVSSPGFNISYTARLELLPFGYFSSGGDFFQGDLIREKNPKLSVAAAYNFNNEAERAAGQRGQLLYENRSINNYFADFLFKHNGWAFMTEFLKRYAKDPVTINPENPDKVIFVYNGYGYTFQGSYNFPGNYEIVGRYSATRADNEIAKYVPQKSDYYTLGFNKYFRGHTFKLQLDATYIRNSLLNVVQADESWNVRFQIELGI
jgi:phosphate-selective porin OprO/OprP